MSNNEIELLDLTTSQCDDYNIYASENKIRHHEMLSEMTERPQLWPMSGMLSVRRYSNDPYKIPIIKFLPTQNLCLFMACLNILGSEEERIAFSGGDMNNPSRVFESVSSQINQNGYTGEHILQYLKYLQSEGHIKGFKWNVYTNFKWPYIILTKPHPIGTSLVVLGTSTSAELYEEIEAKSKAIEFKRSPNGPDKQIEFYKTSGYKKNRKVIKGKRLKKDSKAYITRTIVPSWKVANENKYHKEEFLKHTHAIGIRFVPWYGCQDCTMDSVKQGNGTPVIFDDKWEYSRQAHPDNLNASIYNVRKIFELRLDL